MISQNSKGQTSKQLSILINKELKAMAESCEREIKIVIRDELEKQHLHDVYSSFQPIQISGKKVKDYNEKHKHQKARPYHHTGKLLESIHAVIDGDVVKIEQKDLYYDDGTSVKDVYEWLDKGTSESEYDVYIMGGKKSHTPYVGYEPQPKHNFKKTTLAHMANFIQNDIIPGLDSGKYDFRTRKGAK